MSGLLLKSFNLCFSKFKCFPTITLSPPTAAATDDQDQDQKITAAATNNNPSLIKNFNSLYEANYSTDVSTSKSLTFSSTTTAAVDFFSSSDNNDSDGDDSVPDFTSAFASHRFFFSSPGNSNSIFEVPLPPPPPQDPAAVVSGGVAVQTDSPDPYSDFRHSMMEMIEARDLTDAKSDWEFLNELLLCYLTLNPKHAHKFIVGAFADVIVSLVASAPPSPARRRTTHHQRHLATSHLSI